MKMEREISRQHADNLVRRITEERERFVSAWHRGAGSEELNQIRKNIKQLDDLLWGETYDDRVPETFRSGGYIKETHRKEASTYRPG
jgi:hypothetical protein